MTCLGSSKAKHNVVHWTNMISTQERHEKQKHATECCPASFLFNGASVQSSIGVTYTQLSKASPNGFKPRAVDNCMKLGLSVHGQPHIQCIMQYLVYLTISFCHTLAQTLPQLPGPCAACVKHGVLSHLTGSCSKTCTTGTCGHAQNASRLDFLSRNGNDIISLLVHIVFSCTTHAFINHTYAVFT